MFDIYTDINGDFLRSYLAKHPEEKESLVKEASVQEELIPKEELTPEAFADKDLMMFPIYSPATARISATYIKAQSDEVPFHVKEAAQKACDAFGLDVNVFEFKKEASIKAAPLNPTDFIFPEIKKLPVVNEETYRMSEASFMKVANKLSMADVVSASRRFIKKASLFGIEPSKEIEKMALLDRRFSPQEVHDECRERFLSTGDERYNELAEMVKEASYSQLPLIVEELILLDKEHNIEKTAEVITKLASEEKSDIIVVDGVELPFDKVAGIPQDEWREVLPYEDIAFFDENGFNKEKFEEFVKQAMPHEQDIILSFIASRL